MNTRYLSVTIAVLGLTLSTAGQFALGADFGATLKAGTTGIGGDVTMSVHDKLNVRAGLSMFSWTMRPEEEEDEDENITLKLKLQSVPLLLDWHPFDNNFRLSAGLILNNNEASARAREGDRIDFNEREYQVESFSMDLSFNRVGPYLGIGFGNAAKRGRRLVFALDFGVMFHGTPKLEGQATAADPVEQDDLDRDLEIEIADFRDDLRPFKIYPVINFGISYRF